MAPRSAAKGRKAASFRDEEVVENAVANRVSPHSLESETFVLGAILMESQRCLDIALEGGLVPESFWHRPHQVLFEAIRQMASKGTPIDFASVCTFLEENGRLEDAGGVAQIERIALSVPTTAFIEHHVQTVAAKHLLRTIIDTATEAQEKCFRQESAADLILSEVEQSFLGISDKLRTEACSWKDAITATVRQIDDSFERGRGSLNGISTGFANLDKLMYGLRESEMIVLAARPSMGKTSLAMNICENVALGVRNASGPCPVGIFSCEMSQDALAMRMLCARARVSSEALNKGLVRRQEAMQSIIAAANDLGQAPIFVDDSSGLDIMDLRARARRMKKRHGVKLIMIDYLQLLSSREYVAQGRQLEVANISSNLKAMAKELHIPVIVLSQLSRNTEQRDKSGRPKLSDLRDSGAIEQDADVVLMLRRPCKYPGSDECDDLRLAIVDVAKHRNGPTGSARLDFDSEFTLFTDRVDPGHEYDDAAPDASDVGA